MKCSKYHALGNDYLLLEPRDAPLPPPAGIRAICHRHFGVGSDGILYGPLETDQADFGLQIWNPDGTEAEKSGNGLRIFARYLFDQGAVRHETFSVQTLGGIAACRVRPDTDWIDVDMGRVSFHSRDIPVAGAPREVVDELIEIEGAAYRYSAATIGNPHCVLPLPHISKQLACQLGPVLENLTDRFPNRTNVQLLHVRDRGRLEIEIWERGAGYTLASGSSSSAAAAVAHRLGLCDQRVTVHCPGGDLEVAIGEDYQITLSGPATRIAVIHVDEGVFDQTLPPAALPT